MIFSAFIVAVIAFVLAITAGVLFFVGAGSTGVILLAGSWALIWWAGRKVKDARRHML